MLTQDMLIGLLVGAFGAAVLAFVLTRVHWAMTHIGSFFQPQRVMLRTARSPAQVLWGCFQGIVLLGLLLLLIVLGYLALGGGGLDWIPALLGY
jgi:hypothetical protein